MASCHGSQVTSRPAPPRRPPPAAPTGDRVGTTSTRTRSTRADADAERDRRGGTRRPVGQGGEHLAVGDRVDAVDAAEDADDDADRGHHQRRRDHGRARNCRARATVEPRRTAPASRSPTPTAGRRGGCARGSRSRRWRTPPCRSTRRRRRRRATTASAAGRGPRRTRRRRAPTTARCSAAAPTAAGRRSSPSARRR